MATNEQDKAKAKKERKSSESMAKYHQKDEKRYSQGSKEQKIAREIGNISKQLAEKHGTPGDARAQAAYGKGYPKIKNPQPKKKSPYAFDY